MSEWARDHSKLYWLAARVIRKSPKLHRLAVRLGLAEIPPEMVIDLGDQLPVPAEFTVYREPPSSEVNHAWMITEKLITRIRDTSETIGAQFLVFLVPLRGSIYTEEWAVRQKFGLSAEGWNVHAVANRLGEICKRNSLHCIDPTELFVREAVRLNESNQRLYYKGDWHWNANGHRLAAEILARELLQLSWLRAPESH